MSKTSGRSGEEALPPKDERRSSSEMIFEQDQPGQGLIYLYEERKKKAAVRMGLAFGLLGVSILMGVGLFVLLLVGIEGDRLAAWTALTSTTATNAGWSFAYYFKRDS